MTTTPTQAHPSPRRVAGGDTPHPVTACLEAVAAFVTLGALVYVFEIIHALAPYTEFMKWH